MLLLVCIHFTIQDKEISVGEKTNSGAIALIKKFEGLRLHQYTCLGGYKTIGYGVQDSDRKEISVAEAESDLEKKVSQIIGAISRDKNLDKISQNEELCAPLISLIYNIGWTRFTRSNLYKAISGGRYHEAAVEWIEFRMAGGKIITGLEKKRKEEVSLFLRAL